MLPLMNRDVTWWFASLLYIVLPTHDFFTPPTHTTFLPPSHTHTCTHPPPPYTHTHTHTHTLLTPPSHTHILHDNFYWTRRRRVTSLGGILTPLDDRCSEWAEDPYLHSGKSDCTGNETRWVGVGWIHTHTNTPWKPVPPLWRFCHSLPYKHLSESR